jgi:hypothetical protein
MAMVARGVFADVAEGWGNGVGVLLAGDGMGIGAVVSLATGAGVIIGADAEGRGGARLLSVQLIKVGMKRIRIVTTLVRLTYFSRI